MKKITKLTPEQEQDLIEFRQRMWRQSTSCEPMDRATAERAITEAYALVGYPAPRFFWMSSPMTCSLALYVRRFADDTTWPLLGKSDGLRDRLGDRLRDGLRGGLGAGLGNGLGVELRAELGDGLWSSLGAGIWAGLRDGLGNGLWDGIWAELRAGIWSMLGDGLRGGLRGGLRDGLRAGLWDGIWAGLGDELWDGIWAGLGDELGDGIWAGLGDELGDRLGAGIWAGLGDGLRDGLGTGIWAGLRDGFRDRQAVSDSQTYWWGQMDTYWLAFYRFGSMIGVRQREELLRRLDIMERIAASVGFWYPYDDVCFVSDRFEGVHWDEARNHVGLPFRLHRDDGPAVHFRDGWGLYYWHGYRLPPDKAWIIAEKEKLTPEAIVEEDNVEIRRIMLEVFGFDRYIKARGATVIATDESHGQPRRLLEMTIRGETIRVLDVFNGTLEPNGERRRFFLGAVADAETPHEAVAKSYGIDPEVYDEGVRT